MIIMIQVLGTTYNVLLFMVLYYVHLLGVWATSGQALSHGQVDRVEHRLAVADTGTGSRGPLLVGTSSKRERRKNTHPNILYQLNEN